MPVVLFAGLTVTAQTFSPSRGQPLLPSLPSISEVALPHGTNAEVYLASLRAGVNQFHVIFTQSSGAPSPVGTPRVVATRPGGAHRALRIVTLGRGHYVAYTVLDSGRWRFDVVMTIDGRSQRFSVTHQIR